MSTKKPLSHKNMSFHIRQIGMGSFTYYINIFLGFFDSPSPPDKQFRVNSYFGTLVKRISIINWHKNLNFGTFYTWYFYLAAKITKTNFRNWVEKFSLIFFKIHIHNTNFQWNFEFRNTQPCFYKQAKSKYLTVLQFPGDRPIFDPAFQQKHKQMRWKWRNRLVKNWKLFKWKNLQHSVAK